MADNPFDPKYPYAGLLGKFLEPTTPKLGGLLGLASLGSNLLRVAPLAIYFRSRRFHPSRV